MIKKVSIQNFRCFKDLKIEQFERFNLIGGKNNVGKTTLLEGLFLCAGPARPELSHRISIFRGVEFFEMSAIGIWKNLFFIYDFKNPIKISYADNKGFNRSFNIAICRNEGKKSFSIDQRGEEGSKILDTEDTKDYFLKYQYRDDSGSVFEVKASVEKDKIVYDEQPIGNPFQAVFINARYRDTIRREADRFSKIRMRKKEKELYKALKAIDDRITELTIMTVGGFPVIYCDIGLDIMLPIQYIGEGTVKYLSMLLAIANSENGIVLIDEIENGIHHSVMKQIIESLSNVAKLFNVQIFATTHNFDIVETAHNVFMLDEEYPFKYIRLDDIDGSITAKEYDKDTLQSAIELNLEVR